MSPRPIAAPAATTRPSHPNLPQNPIRIETTIIQLKGGFPPTTHKNKRACADTARRCHLLSTRTGCRRPIIAQEPKLFRSLVSFLRHSSPCGRVRTAFTHPDYLSRYHSTPSIARTAVRIAFRRDRRLVSQSDCPVNAHRHPGAITHTVCTRPCPKAVQRARAPAIVGGFRIP